MLEYSWAPSKPGLAGADGNRLRSCSISTKTALAGSLLRHGSILAKWEAAGRQLLSVRGYFVGMISYPTATSSCCQGNKKSHLSADFGDAASSPFFSQTPWNVTSVQWHLRELTFSLFCFNTDLHSGPNCSFKWKSQWGNNVRKHKFIPTTTFTDGVTERRPRHVSLQLISANKSCLHRVHHQLLAT